MWLKIDSDDNTAKPGCCPESSVESLKDLGRKQRVDFMMGSHPSSRNDLPQMKRDRCSAALWERMNTGWNFPASSSATGLQQQKDIAAIRMQNKCLYLNPLISFAGPRLHICREYTVFMLQNRLKGENPVLRMRWSVTIFRLKNLSYGNPDRTPSIS